MAASIHLFLKDRPKKNGEKPIYLRITNNRKHKYISTGVSVLDKNWNPRNEEVRKNHRAADTLNKTLRQKVQQAKEAQAELITHGKQTAKAIKERIKAKENADFFIYADDYLEEKKNAGLHSQHVQGTVAFNKIEQFEGERYLAFKQIDAEYLTNFQKFLQNKHNNKASTVKKTFQPIKKVIRRALSNHLIHVDPFINFKMVKNTNPPKKAKLSIDQIRGIEQLELDRGSWLDNTRNAFLFSFYSGGIRFGDICCLKWENVKGDRLTYRMNKNEKQFSTLLNDYQQKILGKYAGAKNEYIFPFLDHKQRYTPITLRKNISSKNALANKSLKQIVKLLNEAIDKEDVEADKVDQKVSFHVSRHSFAQHAVESGLDVYELMQTLRHSKLETTQKYLKGLDEELADKAMKKVF